MCPRTLQALAARRLEYRTYMNGLTPKSGATSSPLPSNIHHQSITPCVSGGAGSVPVTRLEITRGSSPQKKVRQVDGSTFTVWRIFGTLTSKEPCSMHGGGTIMESRMYDHIKVAQVLGDIAQNTSVKGGSDTHGI